MFLFFPLLLLLLLSHTACVVTTCTLHEPQFNAIDGIQGKNGERENERDVHISTQTDSRNLLTVYVIIIIQVSHNDLRNL